MKNVLGIILAWGLLFGMAAAQNQKTEPAPVMPKPAFGPELGRLSFLIGEFLTETAIHPSPMMPKGATGKGHSTIKWTLDSMFLTVDEKSKNPLLGNYEGRGFMAFDPQEKQYVLSMFNNFGDRPVYKGNFEGDTLSFENSASFPRRVVQSKVVMVSRRKSSEISSTA